MKMNKETLVKLIKDCNIKVKQPLKICGDVSGKIEKAWCMIKESLYMNIDYKICTILDDIITYNCLEWYTDDLLYAINQDIIDVKIQLN